MSRWKTIVTLFSVCLLMLVVSPIARADEWNKATLLTFSEPVEIPGRVLPAGTYQFKLFDSASNRNIVQVFDGDGMHLYATLLAIPSYRDVPADDTVITFEERPSSSPEAIKSWFYPGEYYGVEFLYPGGRAVTPSGMATSTSTPSESGGAAISEETAQATTPEAPTQQVETQQKEAKTTDTTEQQEGEKLPKTASPLPLIGLMGVGSIGAALTLRAVAKRRV